MSLSSFVSIAVLLAAVTPAFAGLGKDTLFKDGLSDPLKDYYDSIPPTQATSIDIPTPQECINRAGDKCSADRMQAVAVTYSDCEVPWVLCRCDDANMSMQTMIDRFGNLKVGVRDYVGAALAVQADGPSAGSSGDFITFNGECGASVFYHEAGHSVDQGINGSPEWAAAIDQSGCVPDDYANSSPAENFAQMIVCQEYILNKGSLPADASCLQPQLNLVNSTQRVVDALTRASCDVARRPFKLYEAPVETPAPEEPAPEEPAPEEPAPEEPAPEEPAPEEPAPEEPAPEEPTEPAPEPEEPVETPAPEDPAPTPEPVPVPTCPAGKVRRSERRRRRRALVARK